MGRPATKPAKLRDGFYIQVKNQGGTGVLVRRDTKEQMMLAAEDYSRTKQVNVLGEMRNDKLIRLTNERSYEHRKSVMSVI